MTSADPSVVLSLSCPDRPGIVHAVSAFRLEQGGDIADSQQYGDPSSRTFFMRVLVRGLPASASVCLLRQAFSPVGEQFGMAWRISDPSVPKRVLIMVSRFGHCLNDLLFGMSSGQLPIDVRAVVSNHDEFAGLSAAHGVTFEHVPVAPGNKRRAEQRLLDLVDTHDVDLVVLARYMQILSPELCDALAGRAINIHHSFLPSFTGGKPYHQAHERGVKLIGATAHYVTAELDEGPIIEQQVVQTRHDQTPADLVSAGQDAERIALRRAVTWHCEDRILLNGRRTVVLR